MAFDGLLQDLSQQVSPRWLDLPGHFHLLILRLCLDDRVHVLGGDGHAFLEGLRFGVDLLFQCHPLQVLLGGPDPARNLHHLVLAHGLDDGRDVLVCYCRPGFNFERLFQRPTCQRSDGRLNLAIFDNSDESGRAGPYAGDRFDRSRHLLDIHSWSKILGHSTLLSHA
jgi:hypothetical protein